MAVKLVSIEIPDYPHRVQISKSRRAVFYVKEDSMVRGKKDIPKSYYNTEKYYFDERGVLYNKATDQPQLANARSVGTPRYWVVNFQDIWNQNLTKQARAARTNQLKDIFRPYIQAIQPIKDFPIKIVINLFDTVMPVDVSNKGVVYTKIIEDLLTEEGKIPDDKAEFVKCSGSCKFVEIKDIKDKKMLINIYKTDNLPE